MGYKKHSGNYLLMGMTLNIDTDFRKTHPDKAWNAVCIYTTDNVLLGSALLPDMTPRLPKHGNVNMTTLTDAITATQHNLDAMLDNTERRYSSNGHDDMRRSTFWT